MDQLRPVAEPVSIVFAANDYYVPYLATLIASILDNADAARPLELFVLERDFTAQHKAELERQVAAARQQATISFVDVEAAMAPYEGRLHTWAHFKMETYFRLLLPQLLPDHHKVLYLDADMVACADVGELFDTCVDGYLVAACKDPDTTGIYNGVDVDLGQPDKRGYMDNVLKIKNPYEYFQAGTIVFNLDEWRRSLDVDEVFAFAQKERWQLLDQDVLNYFCQGRVRFVDMAWNVMFDNGGFRISEIVSHSTPELFSAYLEAREHPKIVHYAGPFKPWSDPEADFAGIFWHYAHMTDFAERIALRESRERSERIERRLEGTERLLAAVDAELMRYEHRSAWLMLKEFCYQKLLSPLADTVLTGERARGVAHDLYRRVHPRRDDAGGAGAGSPGDGDSPAT